MIVMDTSVIIWDALAPDRLTSKALKSIKQADEHHALMIADISIWEISMLVKKGRLEIENTAANFLNLYLQSRNIVIQSITPEIAELSVNFGTEMNSDPADRLIAATAIIHNARLVTSDKNLHASELLDAVW